nr:LipL32 family surface lipoprotein [Marinomonas mediterranea]
MSYETRCYSDTFSYFNVGLKNDANKFFDTYLALDSLNIVDNAKIKNGGKVLQNLGYDNESLHIWQNHTNSFSYQAHT